MLKGYDEKWNQTSGSIGEASYANLRPGTYELSVLASNNDMVWSSEALTMKIIILPSFWLGWWAFMIYIALFATVLWAIVQYNLTKQRKKIEIEQKVIKAHQIHELDEMKFRFFTNVSHEFKTPLTLIINPVEKMLSEKNTEADKSLLNIIYSNACSLLYMVNQILDFRKLDVDKETVNLSGGDIIAFIRNICYSSSSMAGRKSVDYLFITTVTKLYTEFDKEKLRKIMLNLLSNAFKFTPEGGKIEINISILHSDNRSKCLHVCVSDTGPGIADAYHQKIFERFFRLENTPENQPGTGVGLHLSREYARLLEGELSVESKSGEGAVFILEIPIHVMSQEGVITQRHQISEKAEKINIPADEHPPIPTVPLLLIADDNEDFRDFLSGLLSESFKVITASDGEMARRKTLESLPDLVISDVMMPNKDGLEFCREMKADTRTSHIPVILLTVNTSEENQYLGFEAGADDYIAKPFHLDMLKLKVSRLIERQKKMQERFAKKIDISLSEIEVTSVDEKFVQKAVQIVELNLGNPDFLVEDLVTKMAMSRVYFYKKILSLTSKTPSEFIRFIRLKRAAELLEKSQMFVKEVAYQVGFNDVKYFRKHFREEFGVSPNEYKKKGHC
jgi:signal transduction histidine kinase/DNA-binding response OmpR family regulator